jgi:putative transposase
MGRTKFSPQQIAKILKDFDIDKSVDQLTREHGFRAPPFTNRNPDVLQE